MSGSKLVKEAHSLFAEKGLEYTSESIQLLQGVARHLVRCGIFLNHELLDFVIDVMRVKVLVGLTPESTDEEIDAARQAMTDWLEALGWRRSWFSRPVGKAG